MTRNLNPGRIKRRVSPEQGLSSPVSSRADSRLRATVVPTAITLPPRFRTSRILSAVSSDTSNHSGCMMWRVMSVVLTG